MAETSCSSWSRDRTAEVQGNCRTTGDGPQSPHRNRLECIPHDARRACSARRSACVRSARSPADYHWSPLFVVASQNVGHTTMITSVSTPRATLTQAQRRSLIAPRLSTTSPLTIAAGPRSRPAKVRKGSQATNTPTAPQQIPTATATAPRRGGPVVWLTASPTASPLQRTARGRASGSTAWRPSVLLRQWIASSHDGRLVRAPHDGRLVRAPHDGRVACSARRLAYGQL